MLKNASTTRREFMGSVMIAAGGVATSSFLVTPRVAFAQSVESGIDKIPMETRWAVTSGGFLYAQVANDKALLEKLGQSEYNETKKKYGLSLGAQNKDRAKNFGFTGNDAKSVAIAATALVNMYYGPKHNFEIPVANADRASIKCTNCAYWETTKAQKVTDDLCSTFSQYWWEGFVTTMNPKLTLKLVKARPSGDPICEWKLSLKA